jgi:hypothetical protein
MVFDAKLGYGCDRRYGVFAVYFTLAHTLGVEVTDPELLRIANDSGFPLQPA